ncbi:MAG: TetR/AcrR family transcriptional regulator [Verrucomicrobiota bacterium]
MPRPDLTEERTEQILDAFERCILRAGIESSSLEMVAEEAGVKRPIIRHYVGNREALILALTDRFIASGREAMAELIDGLGDEGRVEALLSVLFSPADDSSAESVLIYENLILLAAREDQIRERLAGWTGEFVDLVKRELVTEFPDSKGHQDVAWGIVSIYYNHVSLMPLQLPAGKSGDSLAAAQRLVDSLI